MSERVSVNGAVIEWARRSLNLSREDVARRMKKPPEMIAQWERGEAMPTYVQLERLAYEVLRRPVAVFFYPEPPDEAPVQAEFRALPETLGEVLSPPVVRMVRRARVHQLALEELLGRAKPERAIWDEQRPTSAERPLELAKAIRAALGITIDRQKSWRSYEAALSEWRGSVESAGVYVFKDAFKDDSVSGFCLFHPLYPVIYLNNSTAMPRQIFTLVHELVHVLLRESDVEATDAGPASLSHADESVEWFCNAVAAEVLAPAEALDRMLTAGSLTEERISAIAEALWVSREVIMRAAADRGIVGWERYRQLADKWINQAVRARTDSGRGSYWSNQGVYMSLAFGTAVLQQLYQNRIDQDAAAEYLGVRSAGLATMESVLLKKASR